MVVVQFRRWGANVARQVIRSSNFKFELRSRITLWNKGTCGQGYLGFAKLYLELLELLLELLLQLLLELLLELLLLLLLFSLPHTW